MNKYKTTIEWLLRIGIFCLFIGHGVPAMEGNPTWLHWFGNLGFDSATSSQLLLLVGVLDTVVGILVLLMPWRIIIIWTILWTVWTAVMYSLPFIGEDIWESVERVVNPAACLSLLLLYGLPKNWQDLFKH